MIRLVNNIINIKTPISHGTLRFILEDTFKNVTIQETIFTRAKLKEIQIDISSLDKHYHYEYRFEKSINGIWESISNNRRIIPVFQEYTDNITFSYNHFTESNKLIVIFSSSNKNNVFNYIKTLSKINENKLFIVDENILNMESTAAYYLGKNRKSDYEQKISNLIETIRIQNNVNKDDVILIGSSKGGFASLYYQFKYNYGKSIVGSPTIFLGDIHRHTQKGRKLITYLTGGYSPQNIHWLNDVILSQVKSKYDTTPEIYYHVGKGEPRYVRHAKPFIDHLSNNDLSLMDLDLGNYDNHSQVAEYFPNYIIKTLDNIN